MFKKILKNIFFWLIFIFVFLLIFSFIKRNELRIWKINHDQERLGFFVCKSFDCINNSLTKCQKSFFYVESENGLFLKEFVYGEGGDCIYRVVKSDNTGMECLFDKDFLASGFAPKVMISNYHFSEELQNNCKLVNY